MLIAVTYTEINEKTGKKEQIVSHGYDIDTGHNFVLPQTTPQSLGAIWNTEIQEWVVD